MPSRSPSVRTCATPTWCWRPRWSASAAPTTRHARELIERGYQAAAQKQRFLATLALNDADWAAYQAERRSRMKPPPPPAMRLIAHSTDPSLARHAQAELDRDRGPPLPLADIEHELSTLVASSALPGAFYRLSPAPELPGQASPVKAA